MLKKMMVCWWNGVSSVEFSSLEKYDGDYEYDDDGLCTISGILTDHLQTEINVYCIVYVVYCKNTKRNV